ncbi:OmpA family protein [Vibrio lentus]|uniref:OmpA-like domain-containing protein n=1 Tax=Vibrio lentus TaxID=136468 RepID=A0AB36XGT7_9VIBR|nr:OmpA family protein [Vibrio lentus]MCC4839890.1 OmpA family protein [Vibrio lentus]PMI13248.1 hypothetical protein BCU51_22700 [Vibrio lentus]PMK37654.1 hypothetical protein BCU02_08910 [Vibrio lentus]PMK41951.1 hypothetical protein BCT99_07015 [Vibrio lentus]PML34268.1 hypothetical protein BCT79_10290 [Vibrio lentus]
MKKLSTVVLFLVAGSLAAEERKEMYFCMTEEGGYEYQVLIGPGQRMALNSEDDTLVLLDNNLKLDEELVSRYLKHNKAAGMCEVYTAEKKKAKWTSPEKTVLFDVNQATLSRKAKKTMDAFLTKHLVRQVPLTIEGHTDQVGNLDYNKALARKRALAAAQYMIKKGYEKTLLTVSEQGERAPKFTNDTASGRQKNRRVEIRLR